MLKIGIWEISEEFIECKPRKNSFIGNDFVKSTRMINGENVWDWPTHFAEKDWIGKVDIQDLMTALAIKRRQLGLERNEAIDEKTWRVVNNIMFGRSAA